MKYLFLFAVFAFMSFTVVAQKYVPFPKHGAVWYESFQNDSDPDPSHLQNGYWYHIKQEKDTVIYTMLYTLLSTVHAQVARDHDGNYYTAYSKGLFGAMREDSIKRVYFYDLKERKEHLLYDFNMQIGDTIPEYFSYYPEEKYEVVSIDSILISNIYRKRYGVGFENYSVAFEYIIEGIGSLQGLKNKMVPKFEIFYSLGCFSLNGKRVYPDTSNYSCEIIVSVNEEDKKEDNFKIFPNPTTGQFTIQTQSIFGESDICVRDILGRIVLQEKLQSPNQTFNISNQPKGLYFVEFDYIGRRIIQKIILQ